MGGSDRTLYPMLGVGAFFAMFWVGFVVGYELGLSCGWFLLNALFFACTGAWFVARLEVADARPGARRNPRETTGGRASAPLPGAFALAPFVARRS